MALYTQIPDIVNDAVEEMLGTEALTTALDTSNLVSLGESIANADLYELFYGKLLNRIVGTMYAARVYETKKRGILRDETEWGAFKQKVHYTMPEADDNPALGIPQIGVGGARTYNQHSPYDVETVIAVETIIFGGQGTWSIEFIRPIAQIKSAFTSTSEMMAFIDGLYITAENAYKIEEEAVENMAANTGIAKTVQSGKTINLLTEYNATLDAADAIGKDDALKSLDFLKFSTKRINDVLGYMAKMSTLFNAGGTQKFTPKDRAVVEVLHEFGSACETYLQSDTYHNELVKLPLYNDIAYWQGSGTSFDFDDVSKINIQNDALVTDDNVTGTVAQDGVVCFIHDIDAVAAFFGERYTWEQENKRDRIMIHGEQARKGYAVDPNENMVVFVIEETE